MLMMPNANSIPLVMMTLRANVIVGVRGGLTSPLFVNNKFETGSTRMGSHSAGKNDINICLVHSMMLFYRTRLPRTVRNIFKTVSQ